MAAPMKASNLKSKQVRFPKPNQNDLRKLMKEKQQSAVKEKDKKIDSPLAKYNNIGQLFCVLCNCQVKSELLWPAHVNGRQHKQCLEDLKKQKQQTVNELDQPEFKKPQSPLPTKSILKRKIASEDSSGVVDSSNSSKRLKDAANELPSDFFDTPSGSATAVTENETNLSSETQSNSLSSEDDDDDEESKTKESKISTEATPVQNRSESLPEGFFDDPLVDAKVRKVEYRDPAEEEWEKFQREIATATNKAQVIIDEDEEESTTERQIVEIDEQINNWARVDALQKKKAEMVTTQKTLKTDLKDDNEEEVDMNEFEEFLDWRSKKSWIKN